MGDVVVLLCGFIPAEGQCEHQGHCEGCIWTLRSDSAEWPGGLSAAADHYLREAAREGQDG